MNQKNKNQNQKQSKTRNVVFFLEKTLEGADSTAAQPRQQQLVTDIQRIFFFFLNFSLTFFFICRLTFGF